VVGGGRFIFGFGSGFPNPLFANERGLSHEDRHPRLRESLDLILKCWTSAEPFDWDGKYWRGKSIVATPRPLHRPHMPMATATDTEAMIELAGQRGYTLLSAQLEPAAFIRKKADRYARAALASEASGQRGNSIVRAPDTRPEPGSSARAALASEASGQRGNSMVRAHSASKDARERADDTRPEPGSSARAGAAIHPAWVRVTHCVNVVAMVLMIGSGWEIYNASPLFPFVFPRVITLGGWLAGALLWHFAAMWLLVVNGLVYVVLGIVTGRFRRKLIPIRPGEVLADAKAALMGKLAHDDLSVYNAVQKLLYLGVILAGIVIVLSGIAIWKPVQLQELTAVFGGYDAARYVHFLAMAAIVGFLVVHVVMALLVPKSLRAIITGR
jgi:thiosulfate reductase cytochrome b subunit